MFTAWGYLVVRYRKLVVILAALFAVFAAVWGLGLFGQLVDGGFDDESSESWQAIATLNDQLGRDSADFILIATHPDKTVDDPSYAADLTAAAAVVPSEDVVKVQNYFTTGSPAFVSQDRHSTFVLVTERYQGAISSDSIVQLTQVLTDRGYDVRVGGTSAVFHDISNTVAADITKAEMISMPILLVLLVLIFGSVVSALLPLIVGGMAILGAFTMLRVINNFTDVSIFAVNLVTIMGLGLAIDYGLLMVGRFREEIARGRSTEDAVARTVQTAGRTVAISALTVAVSLCGLTLFPMTFLQSMGFGGISAVVVSALVAILVLPAILAMLGPNIEKWRVRKLRPVPLDAKSGFWFKLAQSVMRRPGLYLLASGLVLAVMFIPFFNVKFGGIDERVLPTTADPRVVSEELVSTFGSDPGHPIIVAVSLDENVDTAGGQAALGNYLSEVKAQAGVIDAQVTGATGNLARVTVTFPGEPLGDEAKNLVERLRACPTHRASRRR